AAVLQVHLQAGRGAEPDDLGRIKGKDECLGYLGKEVAVGRAKKPIDLVCLLSSIFPGFQHREEGGGTRLIDALDQAEPGQREDVVDARLVQEELLDLVQ